MAETRQRDSRIDFTKGILIILVVLGHCIQISFTGQDEFYNNCFFKLIYSFHMPAFMLISGWLFYSSRDKAYSKIAISKLQQIGIPFLAFCGTCYCIKIIHKYLVSRELEPVWNLVCDFNTFIFSSHTMWFLLSVLINCMIVKLIQPRNNKDIRLWVIALLMLFIPKNTYLYAECIYMFPYFVGGYFLHMNNEYILVNLKKNFLYLIAFASFLGLIFFNRETYIYTTGISLWTEIPMHQLLINTHRFALGLSMSLIFFYFVNKIPESVYSEPWFRKIAKCGKQSLAIYGFQHIIAFIFISKLFTLFNYSGIARFPIIIITTLTVLTLCHWCIAICKKSRVLSMLYCGGKLRNTKNK